MKKIEFLKSAVGLISGIGVSKIIHGIISSTTPTDTRYQKATVAAGELVIGMIAGDLVRKHTDAKIDAAVAWWQKTIGDVKKLPPTDQSNIPDQSNNN